MDKYYLEIYLANYRKDGDYKSITKDNFVGPKDLPPKKVTNTTSSQYSKTKMPFEGSNMYGKWKKDRNGVEYYVIVSYRWYPIYLFKQGVWYKVTNSYSISTAKQMSNVNPVEYDENVGHDVILVTNGEMQNLEHTSTYDDIMKNKPKMAVKDKETLISKKPKFARNWWGDNPPIKVRFKITDIREEGDKAIVDVTIDDAGRREGNKMIPSNGGYLKGEVPGATKEKVENTIKDQITLNFKDYIGKLPLYHHSAYDFETTPEKHKIKFNFIHSKA